MKNIHIIPTDKPSKLGLCNNQLTFLLNHQNILVGHKDYPTTYQHIYITSSEEIREGDYGFDVVHKCVVKITKELIDNYLYKKIILTTDPDLMKDGVQAIDNEFLEWFVKNPSCEFVEVESFCKYGFNCPSEGDFDKQYLCDIGYKIIIPKEKPKTNLERLPFPELVEEFSEYYKKVQLIEEPKQEMPEEAAEKDCLINSIPIDQMIVKNNRSAEFETPITMFIRGAKWQAERMYSEEDLIGNGENSLDTFLLNSGLHTQEDRELIMESVSAWIEQFKKK
jgi:hypothetical protein